MSRPVVEQLEFDFEFGCPFIEAEYYRDGAQDLIQKLVPADLLEPSAIAPALQRARFADMLPLIRWSDLSKAPCSLSVLLLCKYRLNACNFFYDMICRWLLPQRRVNVELFFASDVRLPHLSDDLLSVAEVVVYLKSAQDAEEVRRNFHAIETEIRLGVVSNYHARRILEFKGLSTDGKTAMIQEKIGSLIQSHSKDFDQGIFSQMQQFLVNCPDDFKTLRDYHHISRIISNLHSLRKLLKQNADALPTKRHVLAKFLKTRLHVPREKDKPVLGVLAGLNFLREHEVFETGHLIAAIRQQLPLARLVEGSSFVDPAREASLQALYLEIEKSDGTDFSLDEVQLLRNVLPDQLKGHIEQLTHPIYMPRNEEEVLRNIMSLSRQLRFVHDTPQVIISFDEPRGDELHFTVILLRIFSEGMLPVQELLVKTKTDLPYISDRVRKLGSLRRKYIKEATVFRTVVNSASFLRSDRSVDLYKARQHILNQLTRALGELRDYNGGMILKQNEQLTALKAALGKTGTAHSILLEKFFHALMPMEVRTSSETEPLKQLFLLLLSATKTESRLPFAGSDFFLKQEAQRVVAVLPRLESDKKRQLLCNIEELLIPPHHFATFSLEVNEIPYTGFLLLSSEKSLQERFLAAISL
ncbi:MAG: hypothetical protein KGJ02_07380 [Verrucomicrobiota bacterium]|nr:hypothetical protein [Verrucomicrobiota bacterium]